MRILIEKPVDGLTNIMLVAHKDRHVAPAYLRGVPIEEAGARAGAEAQRLEPDKVAVAGP